MSEQSILVLKESLKKKIRVLDEIYRLSQYQKELLSVKPVDYKQFDTYVEDKDVCIENLNKLDEGFELLYNRVAEELKEHRNQHKQLIQDLQELIEQITDKSVAIQALEERNKQTLQQVLLEERRELGKGRRSVSVAQNYYKNMSRTGLDGSQFMDQKQ